MPSLAEKGLSFRALHQRDHAFIIPNPWDIGSARILAYLGFEALATTSAGYAFSLGRRDGQVSRDEVLAHAAQIATATPLPVSVDLEKCFGDEPEVAAETIRLVGQTGVAGGSIEDFSGHETNRVYEVQHATDRVRAAVEAARSLPFTFTLTARAENFLRGRTDLNDTIKRLQAYQEAGADVLFAPGLRNKEEISAVVSSVDRPVNVVTGSHNLSLAELSALGVKRVSVGGSLARAALGALIRAAQEMGDHGTFTFVKNAANAKEVMAMFDAVADKQG